MSESPLQSSNGTSSNSNGTSSSKDGAEHLLTSIAQAAEQRMLQAFSDAGATHEGMPGAAAVWVTSLMLAKRLSEPGLSKVRAVVLAQVLCCTA
jgi:hypothetical protein